MGAHFLFFFITVGPGMWALISCFILLQWYSGTWYVGAHCLFHFITVGPGMQALISSFILLQWDLVFGSLVSPVSLSLLQTLVIFARSANINHQGTEISQPLSVLPHLGAWEKARFFQNDGLTECKITRFMLLPLTLLKMR